MDAKDAKDRYDDGNDPERETQREAARGGRGPGAHSGAEQEPRPRDIPGTASAAEGYSESATGQGDPLRGLVSDRGAEQAEGGVDGEEADKDPRHGSQARDERD